MKHASAFEPLGVDSLASRLGDIDALTRRIGRDTRELEDPRGRGRESQSRLHRRRQ
jgi:hypothetical protein